MKLLKRIVTHAIVAGSAFVAALASAGTVTYYHNDLLGSPVVATNESGQVIWRESFRPYGEHLTNDPASANNKIWFTSRRQDAETGLVYMGARYYDPAVGRFVSPDARRFDEKSVHTFTRYAYGANNPYKYLDPDGRRFEFVSNSSTEFKANVIAMRTYLDSAGVGAILTDLDRRPETIYLQQGAPGQAAYDWEVTRTITIDPLSGWKTQEGDVQSPALGLLHEAAHALQEITNKAQFDSDRRYPDKQYQSKEERRVIEKIENPTAIKLGEPTRSSHFGEPIGVRCPTCRD